MSDRTSEQPSFEVSNYRRDPAYLRRAAKDRRVDAPRSVVADTYEACADEIERLREALQEICHLPKACLGINNLPKNGRHCNGQRAAQEIAERVL